MKHLYRVMWGLALLACMGVQASEVRLRACSLVLSPQTMPDASGQPTGLAVEILLAVAKQLNWPVGVDYMPWQRVVEEASAGRCDIVLTALRRSDYERFLAFPREPVLLQSNVLLVRKDSPVQYTGDLEALMRLHSVGLYRDKAVDERFESLRHAPWARVDVAVDARQNLQKLLRGRFDVAIENEMTAVYELRQMGAQDQVVVLRPPLNVVPAYVAFPWKGQLAYQTERFDTALVALRKTDAYRAIVRRYLAER